MATGEGFPIAFIKGLLPGKGARGPTKCLRLHIPCAPLCFAELLLILPERRTRGYKDLDFKWLRSTVAPRRTWTLLPRLHFSSLRGSQHRHLRGKGPGIPWVAVFGRTSRGSAGTSSGSGSATSSSQDASWCPQRGRTRSKRLYVSVNAGTWLRSKPV